MKVKCPKLKSTTEDTECQCALTEGALLLGERMELRRNCAPQNSGMWKQGGKKLICEFIHKNLQLHSSKPDPCDTEFNLLKKSEKMLKGREESAEGYDKDSPSGYQHSTAPRAMRALW